MVRRCCLVAALALAVFAIGCGPGGERIEVKSANDPLAQARAVLQRYADGQPLSSEVSSFPKLVEDVRQVDPAKADILEKGLADIQKASPSARPAKAKEVLQKLQ